MLDTQQWIEPKQIRIAPSQPMKIINVTKMSYFASVSVYFYLFQSVSYVWIMKIWTISEHFSEHAIGASLTHLGIIWNEETLNYSPFSSQQVHFKCVTL